MRVNNQSVATVASDPRTSSAQKTATQSSVVSSNAAGVASSSSDQASLSNASKLVALAKSATTSERQAKLSALTQQVQSGSYQGSTSQAGKGMVKELLQRTAAGSH